MRDNLPFVSVVTPTFNRRKFIPIIKKCFLDQTFPQENMEWIIIDDGTDKIEDLVNDLPNVRYFSLETRMVLGQKRNLCNKYSKGDYIVCFDDDDYYPQERVFDAIVTLKKYKAGIVGSSLRFAYYPKYDKIYQFGPHAITEEQARSIANMDSNEGIDTSKPMNTTHSTNNAMAYTKEFAETHIYPNKWKAEESPFTNNFTEKLVQLDPFKTILQISHDTNTIDKKEFRQKETSLRLEDIVRQPEIRQFYRSMFFKMAFQYELKPSYSFESTSKYFDIYNTNPEQLIEKRTYNNTINFKYDYLNIDRCIIDRPNDLFMADNSKLLKNLEDMLSKDIDSDFSDETSDETSDDL